MRLYDERAWLVVDDSGSMTQFSDLVCALHMHTKYDLESDFDVSSYMTGSSSGMTPIGTVEKVGNGGGDGFKNLIDMLNATIVAHPTFVVYFTDSEANIDRYLAEIAKYKILLVDVTNPMFRPYLDTYQKCEIITNALTHEAECEDQEYDLDEDCECDYAYCGVDIFKTQPFYPNWRRTVAWSPEASAMMDRVYARMPDHYGTSKGPMIRAFAESLKNQMQHITFTDEITKMYVDPWTAKRNEISAEINDSNTKIDQHKGTSLQTRAQLGCEINAKVKRMLAEPGDIINPSLRTRINNLRFRIYTECLDIPVEAALNSLNPSNEVQEGQPMSTQITTTVSLKVSSRHQASLADLKALIAEVERVGGTDESYVNLESAYRNGCFDAVVVTANQVTTTEDPRLTTVLSITNEVERIGALLDLYRTTPELRDQIKPHFGLVEPKAKPAKKATQAKA